MDAKAGPLQRQRGMDCYLNPQDCLGPRCKTIGVQHLGFFRPPQPCHSAARSMGFSLGEHDHEYEDNVPGITLTSPLTLTRYMEESPLSERRNSSRSCWRERYMYTNKARPRLIHFAAESASGMVTTRQVSAISFPLKSS